MQKRTGAKIITGVLIFMMGFSAIIPAIATFRDKRDQAAGSENVTMYEHNGEYYDLPYLEDGPVENDLSEAVSSELDM